MSFGRILLSDEIPWAWPPLSCAKLIVMSRCVLSIWQTARRRHHRIRARKPPCGDAVKNCCGAALFISVAAARPDRLLARARADIAGFSLVLNGRQQIGDE